MNIMTKYGETQDYAGIDFVKRLESRIHRDINAVLVNTEKPEPGLLKRYATQRSTLVPVDTLATHWHNYTLLTTSMINTSGGIIRHDSRKLARLIQQFVRNTSS